MTKPDFIDRDEQALKTAFIEWLAKDLEIATEELKWSGLDKGLRFELLELGYGTSIVE